MNRIGTPPVVVLTFLASGTVTAGEVVALDSDKSGDDRFDYVETCPEDSAWACGVALNTATAGLEVQVQVLGKLLSLALVETDVTKNASLVCNTTAGKLGLRVDADINDTVAIALADDVAGVGDIYLCDPLGLASRR